MNNKNSEGILLDCLKRVAPGTEMRLGIEYILQGKTGGLIVIGDSEEVLKLVNGGFYIGCGFSPSKFYELAKMDGAIILSSNGKRILYANTHLFPNPDIKTTETGTRHRTAERVAKQTDTLVISISQKRDVVTIYKGNTRYMLEEPRVVLSRASQALQTLEKYKDGLDELSFNLTVRELENLATLFDACSVLQRSSIVQRTDKEVKKYIYELGADGRLLSMQAEELMANVSSDFIDIVSDYKHPDSKLDAVKIKDRVNSLTADELLDLNKIAALIGYKPEGNLKEMNLQPRGFRILSDVRRLPRSVIVNLIEKFGNLKDILNADVSELSKVDGLDKAKAQSIFDRLKKYSEYYLYNRPYNRGGK